MYGVIIVPSDLGKLFKSDAHDVYRSILALSASFAELNKLISKAKEEESYRYSNDVLEHINSAVSCFQIILSASMVVGFNAALAVISEKVSKTKLNVFWHKLLVDWVIDGLGKTPLIAGVVERFLHAYLLGNKNMGG